MKLRANRCHFLSQAALQAVDSLDFETLSRRENVDDDDDDDDVDECVEFNEEEVLKRCQGKRKQNLP